MNEQCCRCDPGRGPSAEYCADAVKMYCEEQGIPKTDSRKVTFVKEFCDFNMCEDDGDYDFCVSGPTFNRVPMGQTCVDFVFTEFCEKRVGEEGVWERHRYCGPGWDCGQKRDASYAEGRAKFVTMTAAECAKWSVERGQMPWPGRAPYDHHGVRI